MKKSLRLFLGVASGVFVLDQLTKAHIQYHFYLYQKQTIIPGFFDLTYITNTGAAFGLMAGKASVWKQTIFLVLTLVAVGLIIYFFRQMQAKGPGAIVALGMLLGGAVGNALDRLRLGKVIDFLDFYIGRHHWPAFNLADAAITCGALYLLLVLYRKQE